eukprot:638015-Rhodomonas_salina.1
MWRKKEQPALADSDTGVDAGWGAGARRRRREAGAGAAGAGRVSGTAGGRARDAADDPARGIAGWERESRRDGGGGGGRVDRQASRARGPQLSLPPDNRRRGRRRRAEQRGPGAAGPGAA